MKRVFALIIGTLFLAAFASATSITPVECTVGGNTGGYSPAAGANSGSASFSCGGFTAPAGDYIDSVTVEVFNSFTGGAAGSNSFTFTWSNGISAFANTDTASGGIASTLYSGTPTSPISQFSSETNLVDHISGTSTLAFAGFTESVSIAGGTLASNGHLFADAFVTYDYLPSTTTPEPGTLAMIGSGLLGFGMLLRKRR